MHTQETQVKNILAGWMIINLFKKQMLSLFLHVMIHEGAYLNSEVDSKFKTDLHVRTELDTNHVK